MDVSILEQDFIVSNTVNGEKSPGQIGNYVFVSMIAYYWKPTALRLGDLVLWSKMTGLF